MHNRLEQIYDSLREQLNHQGMLEPIVCGDGPITASLLMLGEAPGGEEVKAGRPFVGKAGKNLDVFLQETGIRREEIFISNVVKFRPYRIGPTGRRANRPPNKQQVQWCSMCLQQEIALLQPKLIITLGNFALKAMMGEKAQIGECHGTAMHNAQGYTVFALYHPASVIYNQSLKAVYAEDLQKLKYYLSKMIV